MNSTQENKNVWNKLYSENKSIMQYPNENLVIISNYFLDENDKIILDLGFGSGNNLIFFKKIGKNVYGAEISQEAINFTKRRISDENIELKLIINDKIDYHENFFDVVVAWQSICYNTYDNLMKNLNEIKRILKPNGKFIITLIKKEDSIFDICEKIGNNDYRVNSSNQKGAIIFLANDENEIKNIFKDFKNVNIGYFEHKLNNIGSHWVIYGMN